MVRPRLTPGAVIDGFTLGEVVHKGGMAMLWSVTHPDHDLPMLMKVPLLSEGEDPAAIVSFEMEQMILPRLKGPHVPRFIATAGFDVQPYIVMEQVDGVSADLLLPRCPLPVEEVASFGAAVATALADLHAQQVVHLDIKPANILLRPDGSAVLIDFGLSRHDRLPDLMQEEFRLPYGSAPYMAPEQVLGERGDPHSDLFALGAVLYQLTTGVWAFDNEQRLPAMKRRLWRDPEPPRRRRPDCPPWLQEVILRCLEVDPARRHPTAAQLAFDLRHPDQVMLTPRAQKTKRDGLGTVIKRRFNPDPMAPRPASASAQLAAAPIIAVAIELPAASGALDDAMRRAVARIMAMVPEARLACLNVLRTSLISIDSTLDADGQNRHVQRLVELRHWAAPLRLEEERLTFHVLEALSPAAAILEYAEANRVDHLILGARPHSVQRRLLGSVSGEVAAWAPCSVTVVRAKA